MHENKARRVGRRRSRRESEDRGREWRLENGKEAFLPNQMIHNYFHRITEHCDPGDCDDGFYRVE